MVSPGSSRQIALARIEDSLLVLLLVAMIVLAFLQILLRNVFGIGLVWIEPLVRQMLLWVALLGGMVATREHNHITVDALSRLIKGRPRSAVGCFCDTFAAVVCGLLTYATFQVFFQEFQDPKLGQIVMGLPAWASLATLPAAFSIMAIRFGRFALRNFRDSIRGAPEK